MLSRIEMKYPVSGFYFSIFLFFICALAAMFLSQIYLLQRWGLGLLTISMLIGLTLGNVLPQKMQYGLEDGLAFCKQRLLRIAVAVYGFRLSIQQIQAVGIHALIVDIILIVSTMALAIWLGRRWLKLDRNTAILIGAGHAICGAAAILATSSVLKARNDQVAVAVSCIVLFGTVGMFLYPWLYTLIPVLQADPHLYGVFTGATLHEVAQVVAAGQAMTPQAAEVAIVTKLIRVLLLAPFLLILCMILLRQSSATQSVGAVKMPIFVFGFIACMLINSWVEIPGLLYSRIILLDDLALATAMVALGVSVRFVDLKRAGLKPIALALLLTVQLMLVGACLTYI